MIYADLTIVLAGLGVLILGCGISFFVSHQLRKSALTQAENEAEGRVRQQLAEEERAQRLGLLEEKDEWYKIKAQQEAELEEQLAELNRRDKGLVQRDRELYGDKEELNKEWTRWKNLERRIGQREQGFKSIEREKSASTGKSLSWLGGSRWKKPVSRCWRNYPSKCAVVLRR